MPDQSRGNASENFHNRMRAVTDGLFTARIKSLLCVGCEECLAVCRYGVFRRTTDGIIEAKSGHKCVGCLKCLKVCRTKAIHILPGKGFVRTR